MIQKTIKIFINEVHSKAAKRNYITNKIDVYHIDDIWRLDILDLNDYGPEKNRGYRYVLVTIDNFSKFGWTVPIKNNKMPKQQKTIEKFLIGSKRKPNLLETDRGKEFYNNLFQNFLNANNINVFSKNISLGAVFAERFNRTTKNLLKGPVFEKSHGNWIDVLLTKTKQYSNRIHSSTKLTLQ